MSAYDGVHTLADAFRTMEEHAKNQAIIDANPHLYPNEHNIKLLTEILQYATKCTEKLLGVKNQDMAGFFDRAADSVGTQELASGFRCRFCGAMNTDTWQYACPRCPDYVPRFGEVFSIIQDCAAGGMDVARLNQLECKVIEAEFELFTSELLRLLNIITKQN